MSTFAKVKIKGKKSVYLENPHEYKGFIIGYQVDKYAEAVLAKTPQGLADVKHMIQLGEGVTVVPQTLNKMYCELEDQKEGANG